MMKALFPLIPIVLSKCKAHMELFHISISPKGYLQHSSIQQNSQIPNEKLIKVLQPINSNNNNNHVCTTSIHRKSPRDFIHLSLAM